MKKIGSIELVLTLLLIMALIFLKDYTIKVSYKKEGTDIWIRSLPILPLSKWRNAPR